jgi:hypothetical protein
MQHSATAASPQPYRRLQVNRIRHYRANIAPVVMPPTRAIHNGQTQQLRRRVRPISLDPRKVVLTLLNIATHAQQPSNKPSAMIMIHHQRPVTTLTNSAHTSLMLTQRPQRINQPQH